MSPHSEVIAYALTLSLLTTCLILFTLVLIFFYKKQTASKDSSSIVLPPTQPSSSVAFSYALTEIDLATDGFNPRRVVGKGRLGTTYIAILKDGNWVVVKRIHPWLVLSRVGGFGFQSEIKSLSLAQHPNLVPVVGYAVGPGERIVVMKLVGVMSLEFYLHHQGAAVTTTAAREVYPVLDWGRRVRIMAGVARGLEYLHDKMVPPVVHGCVKPSNVLIDEKFCGRVCDYGLSFLGPMERSVGYVDGEEYWRSGGGACKESDVYGFGVIVLEILSGRKSEGGLLVRWALPLIKEMRIGEVLDPRIEVPEGCLKVLVRLAKVASACVGNSRKHRPSMAHIATILNNLEAEVCF